jgi:hypothetical protein
MTYTARVSLKQMNPIGKDTVDLVFEAQWRKMTATGTSPNGFTCLGNGAKVFTSDNPTDISLVLTNGCWDTKMLFKDVKSGDKVYIVPKRSLFQKGLSVMGVEAIATTEMFRLDSNSAQRTWQLDKEETSDGSITLVGYALT